MRYGEIEAVIYIAKIVISVNLVVGEGANDGESEEQGGHHLV
jgi:hypothetical protein